LRIILFANWLERRLNKFSVITQCTRVTHFGQSWQLGYSHGYYTLLACLQRFLQRHQLQHPLAAGLNP